MIQVHTISQIKQLGSIMGVWAHPDDETFTMAGIMAQAIANGQAVVCLTATKGEAGSHDVKRWPPDTIAEVRANELFAALKELGVTKHHWLGYVDGCCHQISDDNAADKIAKMISYYKPDSIFTFGPEGMTGHLDHQSVSRWTDLALSKSGHKANVYHAVNVQDRYDALMKADKYLNIFFNIDEPPVVDRKKCTVAIDLPPKLFGKKIRALKVMPSQTERMFELFDKNLEVGFQTESFILEEK